MLTKDAFKQVTIHLNVTVIYVRISMNVMDLMQTMRKKE